MSEECFVQLKILSNLLLPKEIDSYVGVISDQSWKAGDYRKNTRITEKSNGWVLNSGLGKQERLISHINKLLERIYPYREKLKFLSQNNTIEFSCVVYSEEVPPLYFEKDIIEQLSMIGATLDIDLYVLGEP